MEHHSKSSSTISISEKMKLNDSTKISNLSDDNNLSQPLIENESKPPKKTNFKHESFKQSASVNETNNSVESDDVYLQHVNGVYSNSGMEAS